MSTVEDERKYWDAAAEDPEVDTKYIADVDTSLCLDAIVPQLNPGKVLEVGSGVGRLAIPLAQMDRFTEVVLYDISAKMHAIAKLRAQRAKVINKCHFRITEGRKLNLGSRVHSAYSMLLFQHLDPETIQGYLAEVYKTLKRGGTFRFQYVMGDFHAPLDHNYMPWQMRQMVLDAGFTIKSTDYGLVHKQWVWMTVVRP